MGFAIALKRIGGHALDQLEMAVALASAEAHEAPGGGPIVKLRTAEFVLTFAKADGSAASPATVLPSESPLPPSTLRALLAPLDYPVLVALDDLEGASPASLGQLVLRVSFPDPPGGSHADSAA